MRFHSAHQAIAFYLVRNPARLKIQNLLEPEYRSNSYGEYDLDDIWAAVALAIKSALEGQLQCDRACFHLLYLTERSTAPSIEDVARSERISVRKLKRTMYRILDLIASELARFDLWEEKEGDNKEAAEKQEAEPLTGNMRAQPTIKKQLN